MENTHQTSSDPGGDRIAEATAPSESNTLDLPDYEWTCHSVYVVRQHIQIH